MNVIFSWQGHSLDEVELLGLLEHEVSRLGGAVYGETFDIQLGRTVEQFPSPFLTALVLTEVQAAGVILSPRILNGAQQLLALAGNTETGWGFFVDGRGYPPDSDDTAVVADFLLRQGAISTRQVRSVAELLSANQCASGGYYVWLSDAAGRRRARTTDSVVDANVAGFLTASGHSSSHSKRVRERATRLLLSPSGYYDQAIVAAWLRRRWDYISTGEFVDIRSRRRLVDAALPLWIASGVHPGIALSLSVGESSEGLPYPSHFSQMQRLDLDSTARPWLFRHRGREVGYCCPLLNLACAARAVVTRTNQSEHTQSKTYGALTNRGV